MTYTGRQEYIRFFLERKKKNSSTHRTVMIILEHTFIAYGTMVRSLDFFLSLLLVLTTTLLKKNKIVSLLLV